MSGCWRLCRGSWCGSARRGYVEPAPGSPELTNTFRDGTLSELPGWLCEILRPQHRDDDAASKIDGEPQGREQAYAASVLEKCVAELEQTPPGNRNNRLNSVTYRLGRMIARNWIELHVVVSGLVAASRGLISDDGPELVRTLSNSRAACRDSASSRRFIGVEP